MFLRSINACRVYMCTHACTCLHMQLYRPLNVRIVVVHVTTWTTGDRIQYPSDFDSSALLDSLAAYEPDPPITVQHDSTMLITCVCSIPPNVCLIPIPARTVVLIC